MKKLLQLALSLFFLLSPAASAQEKDNPFAAQRSDDWTWADMYESYTGKKCTIPGMINRQEIDELRKALQAADLERRAAEARLFLESLKK